MVVSDLDRAGAEKVAAEIGGVGLGIDVSKEVEVKHLVDETIARFGAIDLFCSNAGIFVEGDIDAPDSVWMRMRDLHVLAHVYAARAVLPGDAKAWRGIPAANRFRRGTTDVHRIGDLCGHQARLARARRMDLDDPMEIAGSKCRRYARKGFALPC